MLLVIKIGLTITVVSIFAQIISSICYDKKEKGGIGNLIWANIGYYSIHAFLAGVFITAIALIWSEWNV